MSNIFWKSSKNVQQIVIRYNAAKFGEHGKIITLVFVVILLNKLYDGKCIQ